MKTLWIFPVLAAASLSAAACEDDSTTPQPGDTRPSVRFFNGMTGMTSSGGFAANGQFVTGSALAFGQSTDPCVKFDAGLTTFDFGAANSGGSALSGNVLASLPNLTLANGGNYTVAAIGNGAHSILYMLPNTFAGTLGSNQAAVRFVNLAATADSFTVAMGTTVHASKLGEGMASTFATVPSGSTAFSISQGAQVVLSGSAATVNLQSGSVNTVAIVHNGAMGAGFRLIALPRCS